MCVRVLLFLVTVVAPADACGLGVEKVVELEEVDSGLFFVAPELRVPSETRREAN